MPRKNAHSMRSYSPEEQARDRMIHARKEEQDRQTPTSGFQIPPFPGKPARVISIEQKRKSAEPNIMAEAIRLRLFIDALNDDAKRIDPKEAKELYGDLLKDLKTYTKRLQENESDAEAQEWIRKLTERYPGRR